MRRYLWDDEIIPHEVAAGVRPGALNGLETLYDEISAEDGSMRGRKG